MSSRLAPVVVLLLAACAAWDTSSPGHGPPPGVTPTPSSHYAPPPPVRPGDPAPPDEAPSAIRVAIASVQLFDNCPDPPEAERAAMVDEGRAAEEAKRAPGYRAQCSQSTVQLAMSSDRDAPFRVEAVRVLDGATQRVVGTSTLRGPTRWNQGTGTYLKWDELIPALGDLKVSYKLGDLDLSRAAELAGPGFDTYSSPFMLELDISIGATRMTLRSPQFRRQNDDMVET